MDIASSSFSSSIVAPQNFGVFLSFRGTDTRNTFVSHLYDALRKHGILTFIDSEDFQKGREISKLVDEIEKSNVSVVILSPNYADSPWCLEELVKILECRKNQEQQVVPIFYHVDPTHVKNQTGSYGKAFKKHKKKKKYTAETLRCWRKALTEVGKLSGREVKDNSSEAQAVKDIVKDISNILKPLYANDFPDLVGIQQRIQEVKSLLCIGETDIRVIGIWGMGGLGKTTLAQALFEKLKSDFDGSCFLVNVRERSKGQGLKQLQEELVLDIFDGKKYGGTANMLRQLCHKKILVVLDDIDNPQQFEKIFENNKMHPGSRIIATSRDKQVLRNVGSDKWVYKIEALEEEESLQLFMLHALKEDCQQKWHSELSKEFVSYVKGNPLGLTVLGRHLQGKDEQEWRSALCKIKKGLHKELTEALKISFDGLDFHDKQIFLDIACFFNRNPTSEVRRILHACYGSSVEDGLRNLADKSLVTMSSLNVDMHDLLEEMGKEVVREESRKEPGKRSRLWDEEDIEEVLTNETGSAAVEGILMVGRRKKLKIAPTAFEKMPKLKLLKLNRFPYDDVWELPNGLKFLPKDELRHFEWDYYPLTSLPSEFVPQKLVTLKMFDSNVAELPWNGVQKFPKLEEINIHKSPIKRLWTGVKDMPNLKIMSLVWCWSMTEMPDLSQAPELEELYFSLCGCLKEVSPSISRLKNIKKLDFSRCEEILSFPIIDMPKLKIMNLSGCNQLIKMPDLSKATSLEELDCSRCENLEEVSPSISNLSKLEKLDFERCKKIRSFPSTVKLSLKYLPLHGCSNLGKFPEVSRNIERLDLAFADIAEIPEGSFRGLSSLRELCLPVCKRLGSLPDSLSCLSSLQKLDLWGSSFESIPKSISQLSQLKKLNIGGCKRLQCLPELPSSVCDLYADGCESLQNVSFSPRLAPFEVPERSKLLVREHLLDFSFADCIKLDESAREKIFAFAQQSISTVVAPTVNKWREDPNNDDIESRLIRFVVSGNKMPDWIQHQSDGGGITIDCQPLNLLGFLVCAVFDFRDVERGARSSTKLLFKVQLNSNYPTERSLMDGKGSWLHKAELPHTLLCYVAYAPHNDEEDSQYSKLSATMDVMGFRDPFYGKDRSCRMEVIKWGLSLIYKDGDDEEYDKCAEEKDMNGKSKKGWKP